MKIWVDMSCSFLIEAKDHDEAREKALDKIYEAGGMDVQIEGTDDANETEG